VIFPSSMQGWCGQGAPVIVLSSFSRSIPTLRTLIWPTAGSTMMDGSRLSCSIDVALNVPAKCSFVGATDTKLLASRRGLRPDESER
jgi:hypothetical protein